MTSTSVYVIGPRSGPQKIGISTHPRKRLGTLQNASALQLQVHRTWEMTAVEARIVERICHWKLRASQSYGEWFDVTPLEAMEAVEESIADARNGERAGKLPSSSGRAGRPALNHRSTNVRLPPRDRARIEALVGSRGMAQFIREAVVAELNRHGV